MYFYSIIYLCFISYFTLELPLKGKKSVYSETIGSPYMNQPTKSINMEVLQAKQSPFLI